MNDIKSILLKAKKSKKNNQERTFVDNMSNRSKFEANQIKNSPTLKGK